MDKSIGERPTGATVGDSRMGGTTVQNEWGGLTVGHFAGTHFPRERDGSRTRALDNLKVPKATGLGDSWGRPRVVGREIPGGSEATHLHLLGHKPAQALGGPQEGRLDPVPCPFRVERGPISDKDRLTDTHSDSHTHMYVHRRIREICMCVPVYLNVMHPDVSQQPH